MYKQGEIVRYIGEGNDYFNKNDITTVISYVKEKDLYLLYRSRYTDVYIRVSDVISLGDERRSKIKKIIRTLKQK